MSGKYYWLKLKKDFFKRHDIRIIEAMPNGKDYILFYLKLLVESVDHEGQLRFSDTIPYNADMLSVITNTNVDIVKSALKVFTELKMIEVLDDCTIYMNEVSKMIGSAADNDNAIRQQRFRDNQKASKMGIPDVSVTKNNASVTECVTESNESKSIEKDIEIDKEKDIDKQLSLVPQPALISKEEHIELLFKEFWKAYPRKDDKKRAWLKFKAIKNIEKVFPDIIADVEAKKLSEQWNEKSGKYIPMPSTYLNNERWNDEDTVTRQSEIENKCGDEISGFL